MHNDRMYSNNLLCCTAKITGDAGGYANKEI